MNKRSHVFPLLLLSLLLGLLIASASLTGLTIVRASAGAALQEATQTAVPGPSPTADDAQGDSKILNMDRNTLTIAIGVGLLAGSLIIRARRKKAARRTG